MYKNPIRPLLRKVDERYREARMLGDKEGMRSCCLELYNLGFLQIKVTEEHLRGVAHLIKKYYEKEGNSRGVRLMKRFGSRLYLSLVKQKQELLEADDLTNKLLGLED